MKTTPFLSRPLHGTTRKGTPKKVKTWGGVTAGDLRMLVATTLLAGAFWGMLRALDLASVSFWCENNLAFTTLTRWLWVQGILVGEKSYDDSWFMAFLCFSYDFDSEPSVNGDSKEQWCSPAFISSFLSWAAGLGFRRLLGRWTWFWAVSGDLVGLSTFFLTVFTVFLARFCDLLFSFEMFGLSMHGFFLFWHFSSKFFFGCGEGKSKWSKSLHAYAMLMRVIAGWCSVGGAKCSLHRQCSWRILGILIVTMATATATQLRMTEGVWHLSKVGPCWCFLLHSLGDFWIPTWHIFEDFLHSTERRRGSFAKLRYLAKSQWDSSPCLCYVCWLLAGLPAPSFVLLGRQLRYHSAGA